MPLHKDLTGTDLHEPKGIASATSGAVYVSDGAGSGAWTRLDDRVPAGAIQDFFTPVVPSGWLELDGSLFNKADYPSLYDALSIQQTGTRISGSPVITGLASTVNMKAGYFIGGTGIPATSLLILSVDSGSQITMTGNASSSGSSTVIVSPCDVNSTQMRLPNVKTAGRFRRSRTTAIPIGTLQADQNKSHTHAGTALTATLSLVTGGAGAHTHTGNTGTESQTHTHTYVTAPTKSTAIATGSGAVTLNVWNGADSTVSTSIEGAAHLHSYTTDNPGNHTHTVDASHSHTLDIVADGGSETRPISLVVMTCIRT